MVFHQFIVPCDGGLFDAEDTIRVEGQYMDPVMRQLRSDANERSLGTMLEASPAQLLKGDAIVVYAEALKQIDELIDYSPSLADALCEAVYEKVRAAADESENSELYEIADLLLRHQDTIDNYGMR